MSIRSFVTLASLLLMAWLAWAFFHTPVIRVGLDPVTAQAEGEPSPEDGADNLAVSVSP